MLTEENSDDTGTRLQHAPRKSLRSLAQKTDIGQCTRTYSTKADNKCTKMPEVDLYD